MARQDHQSSPVCIRVSCCRCAAVQERALQAGRSSSSSSSNDLARGAATSSSAGLVMLSAEMASNDAMRRKLKGMTQQLKDAEAAASRAAAALSRSEGEKQAALERSGSLEVELSRAESGRLAAVDQASNLSQRLQVTEVRHRGQVK